MNEQELRDFCAKRVASDHLDDPDLTCHGCAHSSALAPAPGRPSGERPCQSCVRNPERDDPEGVMVGDIVVDDRGNARCFDPTAGFSYNGSPYVCWPMDNYVTLDRSRQERFYDDHPDYGKAITFDAGGNPKVIP